MSSPTDRKNDEEAGGVLDHPPPDGDHIVVDDNTNWQYDAVSNSSLTGEFTTITNVLDGHADGAGEQYYSPSRSKFEVVDIIDGYSMPGTNSAPRSNDGSNLGSYDSYYHMQKNGPPIVPESSESNVRHHSIMRYGWRGGGMSGLTGSSLADTIGKDEGVEVEHYREEASESNTNDRASSLSSLTNDFFHKTDRRGGRFFSTPKKNNRAQHERQESISPTSSNDKSSSQSSKMFQKAFTPPRVKRNNLVHGSPWYVNKHHRDTPSPHNSSDQTPMTAHPPGEVLVTPSHKASDSNPTPSVISSSNMSQYFSNELREMYNSNVYRSYRHRYDQALSSPKAKRIMISSVILAALFAIVAIVSISLGARSQNSSVIEASASSYYDTQRNGGLPEKCCVGKLDGEELILEADVQDRIESTTGDNSKAPSPSASPIQNNSPIQNTPPTNVELDWDYVVTVSTPSPTPGAGEDSENAAIPTTPNPTVGEDSNGWKPSILPSWIPPGEKQIPIATPNPTRQPTRKPTRKPTRRPTIRPTRKPTKQPTTKKPTPQPTILSTNAQSKKPTSSPTNAPTSTPPTFKPSNAPFVTLVPTKVPTTLFNNKLPSTSPTVSSNTEKPSSDVLTNAPTRIPTVLVSIFCRAISFCHD